MSNSANYSLVAIHCKYRIGSHYNTSFRAGESYYNRIALHTSNAFFEYIVKSNNSCTKEKALKYTYNNLKFSEGVFATLLHGQQSANIELGSSAIIFGNPDAQIRITIYSNPHCNPCARMHKK